MDRLLKSNAGTIRLYIYDSTGALTNADANPPVVVKDTAETTVVSSTTSTKPSGTTGTYELAMTAAQLAALGLYTATWTATIAGAANTYTTRFEVVGGFLFSIPELRVFDAALTEALYSNDKVREAREYAEEIIELYCGVAFRPRGKRVTLAGNDKALLLIPDYFPTRLVSGSIDGTALTAADISDVWLLEHGGIERKTLGYWSSGDGNNVVLVYEYGMDQPPEDVREAAMILAANRLKGTALPYNTESYRTDEASFSVSVPPRSGPIGIPEVDTVIERHSHRIPAIA
jgi:hypothetical protein